MGDYDYANELIEQCAKAQQRCEDKIATVEAEMQKLSRERMKLINRRSGILLAVSQLEGHAPRSWCHFCKLDCPKPWDHKPGCNKHMDEDDDG